MSEDIQVGDVCLDLAQGRPVHVVEALEVDAAEWSERNNYELTENYGNSRLGATSDDAVFEVVYCSNAKSEPSKTYAMPESRLLRVETEAADGGRPVAERARVELLAQLRAEMLRRYDGDDLADGFKTFSAAAVSAARHVGMGEAAISEAAELADVEATIGGDDGD